MIHSYGRCMKKTYQSHGSVMGDDLQQKQTSATQNLWCHVKALNLTFPFKDFSICSRTLLAIPIIFKNTVSHICIYLLEKLHFPSFEPKMFETFFCTICVCVCPSFQKLN